MADLDHNLSLADALTEPPPQIEEEVKRDFMATLEAEKFDDVVGEKVGKTDYVPLLDDDDVKAGNQEAKTKPHADGVQVERTSAPGPAAVVENGDHGIEGGRKAPPGKIMDDQMAYKEFLDHNVSWKMDERDRCFDSQLAFQPTDVTAPSKIPEAEEAHFPGSTVMGFTDLPGEPKPPEATALAPVGSAGPAPTAGELMGFEPWFDQRTLPPKEALATSPEAPMSKDQKTKAAELAAPAVDSCALEKQEEKKTSPDQHKEKESSGPSPSQQMEEAASKPSEKVGESKAEEAAKPPPSPKAEEKKPSPALHMEAGESEWPAQKAEENKIAPSQRIDEKVEENKISPSQRIDEKVQENKIAPSQRIDEKAEENKIAPSQRIDESKASLSQPREEATSKPLVQKVEDSKPAPSQHAEKVEQSPAPPPHPLEKQEESKPPSSPSCPVEHFPELEKLNKRNKDSPSKPAEEHEEHQQPPAKPVEIFPEPAEPKEPVPVGEPKAEPKEPFPGTAALDLAGAEKPKEGPPVEQPQEKPPRDPEGVSTTQVRQANKSSDHRRFNKAKPARVPIGDAPAELLAPFPAQKSRNHGEDPFATPEWGYVTGTSPRGKAAPRKAAGHPFELAEGQRDDSQEGWDPEASAAFKKKKKKPKQKRNQHPRSVEAWEEAAERLRTPPCVSEPQKPDVPLAVPLESPQEVTGVSAGVLWKDTSKREMEWQPSGAQSQASAPAGGELIQHTESSLKLELDAKAVEFGRAEMIGDDRARLPSKSRKKGSPKEQAKGPAERSKLGSPTSPPAQASPAAISIFGESREGEGRSPKNVGLDLSAVDTGPTASSRVAVSGEAAKPAEVEGGKATPEDPVAGNAVLEGKPRQPGGHGNGRRAGKEATDAPSEEKAAEAPTERRFPERSSPAAPEPVPAPKARRLSDESGPVGNEKPAFGSGESPFSWEAHSDAAKPLALDERLGSGKVPLTDTNKAICSSPPEKPAMAVPRMAADQPKKRSSDGKSKKAKNYPEQQPQQQRLPLSEDMADLRRGLAVEKVVSLPEVGPGAASNETICPGLTENKAARGSAGAGEKPKKRSGDGKSLRAAERSFFGPLFPPEAEKSAGSLPIEVSPADRMREKVVPDKEPGSETGSRLLEAAADTAKPQALSATPQVGKPNVPPPWKGEWADLPSSAYPFITETPTKAPECPASLAAGAQTEGAVVSDKGKDPSPTSAEGSVVAEPGSALPMSKPKKRTSDGRSKKSSKYATQQPETDTRVNRSSAMDGAAKETGAVDKSDSTVPEQPGGGPAQCPAIKPVEGPEGKEDKDSGTALKNSCSEQPPTSARRTSPAKQEPLGKTKDAPSARKGQEISLASLEHLAEAIASPQAHPPFREPAKEEPKIPGDDGPMPQVHEVLEAKLDLAGPAAACREPGQVEKVPSPATGKGRAADHLPRDPEAAGHAPRVPAADETCKGADDGIDRKSRASVDHPLPLGAEAEGAPGAEIHDKPKGRSSDRRRKEPRDGGLDPASRQDPGVKPAKRGSDGKSKKTTSSPEEPVLSPAKADPKQGQHPKATGLEYALEGMEFVDENRNIKSFPPGHPMLWDGNTVSFLGPFGSPGPSPLDEANPRSQCPFLSYQGKVAAGLTKEPLSPPGGVEDSSREERKAKKPDLQEDSAAAEFREAMIEASLLVKAGDKTREKRKKAKQASSNQVVKQDARAEDRATSPVSAEVEGGGVNLLDKTPGFGLSSSALVAVMPEEKAARGAVAAASGSCSAGIEVITPPAEIPAPWENNKEAVALQALTAVLVGGSGEPTGLSEGAKVGEERISECPESLGSTARVDKASEDVPPAQATPANKPQDYSEPSEQGGMTEPVIGREEAAREAAERVVPGSETGPGAAVGLQAVAERPDQAPRETKREERARAPEQIKGYMRPTKSRGLPPPPLRAAAPEPGKRRPVKPDGLGPPRQERAKAEEPKAASEVVTANDIAAPPNKELPPSPEKKAKPSASTPAKPAAAKTKPVSAAAAPAKRPAAATPSAQNKKATSPTAGPAAAATPKRPASSTARPSTLTPKDAKPKGTEAKSAEKRASPSKAPSATTPRSSVRSSPATPRPSTALASTNAAAGPRNAATSPPKRPSTIKTDTKLVDVKKTTAKSPSADLSRPKSAPSTTAKPGSTTPTAASPAQPGAAASRPKPAAPRLSGTGSTTAADSKKASTLKAAPKTSPVAKPPRPPTSVSAPDLKNIRSKIGSTDNIKYQPGGGKAKVERKAESAGAARKPELNAVSKTTVTKEGAPKQPNGKVQIISKKASYSHVQSKCGSKDNIKHVPGGGNVQILNKKIDLSKVSSKCGSKANLKHKPGGGDIKIENQKLNFKEKAQAKVGSLDNVGHVPAGGAVKTEGGEEAAPQNGAVPTPLPGSDAAQENGVGHATPAQGGGDQMEIQSFDTHIQETSI
ncbi:PREDICTED: microtubule-associated protein 4 isoform X3 [Gekko japonicus]|uniref:Microtubule-associated protein n=1 Tax=Gekko japonicus TaxID=146911 RepID=A0ABM1KVW1_GEKJA|nr:PREDICTED: microtubule-associated protein 4 isoform X3 [Gekko japonicus]